MQTKVQESTNHQQYSTAYLGRDRSFARLASYRMQLMYALRDNPSNALLIGKGDGLVASLLESAGTGVVTLDIDPELSPDLTASVESIPSKDEAFDVSICCQVLEHLEFNKFRNVLREIRRVTRKNLVLSLPDVRRFFLLRLGLPLFRIDWKGSLPQVMAKKIPPSRLAIHGHHWEIGFSGFPYSKVRHNIESAGWEVIESQRVTDLPWHTFFFCKRKG